jgi:hypothetical protein
MSIENTQTNKLYITYADLKHINIQGFTSPELAPIGEDVALLIFLKNKGAPIEGEFHLSLDRKNYNWNIYFDYVHYSYNVQWNKK